MGLNGLLRRYLRFFCHETHRNASSIDEICIECTYELLFRFLSWFLLLYIFCIQAPAVHTLPKVLWLVGRYFDWLTRFASNYLIQYILNAQGYEAFTGNIAKIFDRFTIYIRSLAYIFLKIYCSSFKVSMIIKMIH